MRLALLVLTLAASLGAADLVLPPLSTGAQTRRFIDALAPSGVIYLTVDMGAHFETFPNELAKHPHNDRWPLRDVDATSVARTWFERVTTENQSAK